MKRISQILMLLCTMSWVHSAAAICVSPPENSPYRDDPIFDLPCNDLSNVFDSSFDTETLRSTSNSLESIFSEQGNEAIWYLRSKLENGNQYEILAIIQLFEENRIFALLQDVIGVAARYETLEMSSSSGRIEEYRIRSLIQMADYFGLWNWNIYHAYPRNDIDSWNAMFHETIERNPEIFEY
ncbi:MAG: hypothetical protein GKR91_00020 [Pseudomonadales bacterium]|nr:hypothetical protein [Pseudomonadales bacterium]